MNSDKLNEIMNCNCLQSIIDNDMKRHTMDIDRMGQNCIQVPNRSKIIFECFVSYKNKIIDTKGIIIKDRNDEQYHSIPFLFCPICGTKSKHNIPEDTFYYKFQK